MQATPNALSINYIERSEIASEDCLYLNVWTPARSDAAKLPVMVWLYGGVFTGGSAGKPTFNGEGLAEYTCDFLAFYSL